MPQTLPTDPAMLLSIVNMRLRDSDDDLADICSAMGSDQSEVEQILQSAGFVYDADRRRFW